MVYIFRCNKRAVRGEQVLAERGHRMIRITVDIDSGTARYRVAVQAGSIRRALELVERMEPGSEFRVAFPIDPETFFVKDPVAKAGPVERERLAA
jgi:hypothetical protein